MEEIENIYSRARCIENVLNNHLGQDNKYSAKIRTLSKQLENLEKACLFHRYALVEVEIKKTYLKLFGVPSQFEFELTPETVTKLTSIIRDNLRDACEEGEEIYLKIAD